ncbi:MAG: amidohydrolase family protein [Deltaproteobacteria bacterium]|nr:amidohydrolase family protein [Deltaproteobacteria bacterium]
MTLIVDWENHWLPKELFDHPEQMMRKEREEWVRQKGASEWESIDLMRCDRSVYPVARIFSDLEERIKKMDEAGVTVALLSLGLWHWYLDLETAKFVNDEMARVQNRYDGRLLGMAHVPPLDPGAPAEVERAVTKLGLKAVNMLTHWDGIYLDQEPFRPLLDKVHELDVPIFIHAAPTMAEPFAKAYAEFNFPRSTHKSFDRWISCLRIFYSGMLRRYPKLTIVHSHVGGFISHNITQMRHRIERMQSGSEEPLQFEERWLEQMYYDTASTNWNLKPLMNMAFQTIGADHLVFASDWPGGPTHFLESVARIRNVDVGEESKEKVFGSNSRKILKL